MVKFQFERESRTMTSESFVIELADEEVGRVDLHYSPSVTYGTICVLASMTEEEIRSLISEIDERFVLTNDPFREDFVITVWNGREHGNYSDEDFEGEEGSEPGDSFGN